MRGLRGDHGLWAHAEAIADLDLGGLGLRRPAAPCPLFGAADCFHMIVENMIAPEARRAAPPPLAPPFVLGNGCLRISGTGKPARFNARDVFCNTLGLFGLGGGIGRRCLLGQLAGVHDEKTEGCLSQASVSLFHCHPADDTASVPAARGLLACPARLFEQQGHGAMLLAPCLHLLAHRTRARD